ncbi:MAG: hypothetical protein GW858_06330 [Sphingomonadales bacterium]|nr:hypothetical protein [Sphingomonadales bacterium]NCQ21231.1 hypothetical protein [Sphingomonadales bacterium]NCT04004.1 hypothetical protein [Sphingomonadales bacterium]
MSREDVLASLMAQARNDGAALVTLRAIVEEASAFATDRVLDRLKLGDPSAEEDLGELRELLRAWRDAKTSAWKALIGWIVRGALALLLIGIAVRFGLWDRL